MEQKCADAVGTVLVSGLAISSAKNTYIFQIKYTPYGSNFSKQHSETVMV